MKSPLTRKSHAAFLPVIPFLLVVAKSVAAVTLVTDGAYDALNRVDTDPSGTLAAFKTEVSTAATTGLGGVAHFDSNFASDTVFNATYGAKTLVITSSTPLASATNAGSTSSFIPISNSNVANPGAIIDFSFTFAAPSGEGVTSFAFTSVDRNNYAVTGAVFTMTAFYSDGTSSSLASTVGDFDPATASKGLDDTFWNFTAPGGHSITRVSIDGNVSPTLIDDLAFITTPNVIIPEPSAALLMGAGLGLAVLRRRRI